MINMFLYRKRVVELKQWCGQEVEVEVQKSPPFSSPPLFSPLPSLTARGVWERYKLAQRGLGRSPSRQRFWCILDHKGNFWWDLNLPQWRSKKNWRQILFFPSSPSSRTVCRIRFAPLVGSEAGPQQPNIFGHFYIKKGFDAIKIYHVLWRHSQEVEFRENSDSLSFIPQQLEIVVRFKKYGLGWSTSRQR